MITVLLSGLKTERGSMGAFNRRTNPYIEREAKYE